MLHYIKLTISLPFKLNVENKKSEKNHLWNIFYYKLTLTDYNDNNTTRQLLLYYE